MTRTDMQDLLVLLDGSLEVDDGAAKVVNRPRLRATIHRLAEVSALESGRRKGLAAYLIRLAALAYGVTPSSIHNLYIARGRGAVPSSFTVPAMNLRSLSFDAARAVFRVASSMQAGAFIFEIARSEIGYTDQPPMEYAGNLMAAAIAEDYLGPIFIQGDHFQVSASRYGSDPDAELQAVRDLTTKAVRAGFFNIDIDTSTLVDLSHDTISKQQTLNYELSARLTAFIRSIEPESVTISVGGEIGEVGGHNSTEPELRAYMEGYNQTLEERSPGAAGLSKLSIQTGTSHGGVVLPDGTIKEVSVDFDTLKELSNIARQDYRMAGAVQHGASTLPEHAFGKFVESQACEVHLATNFQNMLYDRLPDELRSEIYDYLDQHHSDERKPDQTDEQFYYKTRKRALGPFKTHLWNLPPEKRGEIGKAWERQFAMLFDLLGVADTRQHVDEWVKPVIVAPNIKDYIGGAAEGEDVSDLAD